MRIGESLGGAREKGHYSRQSELFVQRRRAGAVSSREAKELGHGCRGQRHATDRGRSISKHPMRAC